MKRGKLIVFTVILAAGSLWLYYQASRQSAIQGAGNAPLPDLYIVQPQWHLFDEQGNVQRSVHAVHLRQWPGRQGTQLLEPELEIHDRNHNRLRITASEGWIYADNRPILLRQKVILERPPQEGHARLQVKTEQLEIDKSASTATTDAPVKVLSGRWRLSALGMYADLGEHRVELLNQVRGIHE